MKQISYSKKFEEPSQHIFDDDDYLKDGRVNLKREASVLSHLTGVQQYQMRLQPRGSIMQIPKTKSSYL